MRTEGLPAMLSPRQYDTVSEGGPGAGACVWCVEEHPVLNNIPTAEDAISWKHDFIDMLIMTRR